MILKMMSAYFSTIVKRFKDCKEENMLTILSEEVMRQFEKEAKRFISPILHIFKMLIENEIIPKTFWQSFL